MIKDLGKETNEAFGKFLNYSIDHLFDDYKDDVKRELKALYDEYDKAYTKFRSELVKEDESFIKIVDSTHEFAENRLKKAIK